MQFEIPIRPKAKARPRFNGHAYTPKETQEYEQAIRDYVRSKNPDCFAGPVMVSLSFEYKFPKRPKYDLPSGRPDIDNLVKGVMDALNGILWADDAQVTTLSASKVYGEVDRICIFVAPDSN